MELQWRFKINGTEVEEPIGWDSLSITMQRDETYHGLENIFSDNIVFWDAGAQIIKEAFELDGIDADLQFTSEYSCDGGETWSFFITGILNAFFYSIINNEVTIKIEPSGFHRKVKNRLSTPINLLSNTSIGGESMSNINPFDLGLHSKEIDFVGQMVINSGASSFNLTSQAAFNPPLSINSGDIDGLTEPIPIQPFTNILVNGTGTDRAVRFYGTFRVNNVTLANITAPPAGPTLYNYTGGFQLIINNHVDPITVLYTAPVDPANSSTYYDINFDISYTLPASGSIAIYLFDYYPNSIIGGSGGTVNTYSADWQFDTSVSVLNVEDKSIFDPSTAKAFLMHEIFAKLSESMTDEIDSFRSEFYGRTNSEPHQYDSNGCGGWRAGTNGKNLRKMLNKDGQPFPIVTTFEETFNANNAVDNIGMRIERDSITGKEYIRVEEKEFFYNSNTILSFFNVSDLKVTPAQDLIFNTFKVGFNKWNLNISKTNGIDEFNAIHNYTLPIEKANKELNATSQYIASGYVIEQTRRLQYNILPSNDFETDDDMFFICTNVESETTDLYTTPPVSTTYAAGTISERDENFSGIINLIGPTTAYNLRISPTRNALNWYNYVAPSIYKHPELLIKFVNGLGNYQESDTLNNFCVAVNTVSQDQDLSSNDIIGIGATPLYYPEYLEFSYPLSFAEFITLMNNSERAIGVSCSDDPQYSGFIKSFKYTPNSNNGGIGEFKLLRSSCVQGDFNNDFNNDFYTGNC